MKAAQILDVIRPLPLTEKLYIIELLFQDIRENAIQQKTADEQRKKAAASLLTDYQTNEELIAFTILDNQAFHETK